MSKVGVINKNKPNRRNYTTSGWWMFLFLVYLCWD